MLHHVSFVAAAVGCALLAPPVDSPATPAAPATAKLPNFIFIQAEATGWSSTSVDMDGEPPSAARPAGLTPNLETFAAEGMRFSDFYVTAPRCTPSRTSFVTGISPAKLHMTYQNEGGNSRREEGETAESKYRLLRMVPPPVETTLPKGVKTTGNWLGELGYASAHFGKWHVGRQDPKAIGFDLSDGPNSNQGPERGVAPNPKQAVEITDKGIAFMREQAKAGKPFYLQISHYGFGAEEEASPVALAKARELVPGVSGKPLGAIAGQYDMDLQLARVRDAVRELGIADNTYIFFSADHGAQGGGGGGGRNARAANPPFAGAKGSVSEGGIRVPFIVVGPGVPAGVVSGVRATGMDLVPTLRDLAGSPIAKSDDPDAQNVVEGGSLAPVLKSSGENAGKGAVARTREEIVIHFPHYDLNNGGPASAIYLGDFKLVRNDDAKTVKLYDIAKDRGEANDIAAAHPDRVKEMLARLDAYLKSIKAPMATPNTAAPEGGAAKEGEPAPPAKPRGGGGQGGGGRRRQQEGGNS
jgi:arylsulfatase A-like enzyme